MVHGATVWPPATDRPANIALREWRDNWPVAVAGLFGNMLTGFGMMSMGAFMGPVQMAFGWSRSDYALGFSVQAATGVALPPLIGWLIDRFGARPVAVVGSLAVGLAFSMFATATGSVGDWVLLWLISGVANQLVFAALWFTAVASAFTASRGLALSMTMCGVAISGVIAPVMANSLIEAHGFRFAFVAMGLIWGGIVALVAWWGLPRRRGPLHASEPAMAEPLLGLTVGQGLRAPAFYKLVGFVTITYVVCIALTLHLIPILSEAGLARGAAVMIASLFGLAIIAGKVAVGLTIDRVPARLIGALCCLTLAVTTALLAVPKPGISLLVFAVLLGGASFGGIAPGIPYLASRYLGMRNYARLFGTLSIFYAVGSGSGPWIAGKVHDVTHSYDGFLMGVIPALVVAALLCVLLGRYPDFEAPGHRVAK